MDLEQLYEKLCTPEFMDAKSSLAYNFYTYPYDAEKEYEVREAIQDFCQRLSRPSTYADVLPVLPVNLFEEFCGFMANTTFLRSNLLDKNLEIEPNRSADVYRRLKAIATGPEFLQYLSTRIDGFVADQQGQNSRPYIFMYGMGSMYPYLRAHTFLANFEIYNKVDEYKLILFYPGTADDNIYHLFGRLSETRPYRAKLLR